MFVLRTIFILLLFACSAARSSAQSRYFDQWYFGYGVGIDFRPNLPVVSDGAMRTLEGSASISDPRSGNLLFYTDGVRVWDATHSVMPNGTGLMGNGSSAQSALIVPTPQDRNTFYLFTATAGAYLDVPNTGIQYSLVDMRLNKGKGDLPQKNTPLMELSTEMLGATHHCNGIDYWIVAHELGSSRFFAYLLTASGITDTVISNVGTLLLEDDGSPSLIKFSSDGKLMAATVMPKKQLELYDFDNSTGVLSNYRLLANDLSYYGIEFSPDNSKLYAFTSVFELTDHSTLFQYNLKAGSLQAVKDSRFTLYDELSDVGGEMQVAPNGRIYVAFINKNALSVIVDPNELAPDCNYAHLAFPLGARSAAAGLPNCISALLPRIKVGDGNDTLICLGESVQLQAWGDPPFHWTPVDGLSCIDCSDPIATPEKTTTYKLSYSSSGCSWADSVTIVVANPPNADAGNDTTICIGQTVQLQATGGTSYQWSPSLGLNCDNCSDPVLTPTTTTTYYVTVKNKEGCSAVDSVTVTVAPLPVADAGKDTAVCIGGSVGLHATGGVSYRWSPATGLSCTNCADPVASPDRTTTYEVVVTSQSGCTSRDQVKVTVDEAAVSISTPDTTICPGAIVKLAASGRSAYQWSPAEGLSCVDCANPTAAPTTTTTYIVRGTTNGECLSIDSVTITVRSVSVDAGADTMICLGDSARLHASKGVGYSWAPAINISCLYCADPIVSPLESTTYYVEVTDENGCIGRDSVRVSIQSSGGVQATGDTAFCVGGTAQLLGSGAESYRWSPVAGLSCTDCANPTAKPDVTTIYHVIGTTASGGCPALDSVVVTVYDFPIIEVSADTAICAGGSLQLRATGGTTYRWDASADLSCLDCSNPSVTPTETTTYYVSGWNVGDCIGRDSVRVVVHPALVITAGEDKSICIGESVQLTATGGVRWLWEPSDGLSCTDCPDPTASPDKTTVYRVTAWSAEGCEGSDEVEVNVRTEAEVVHLRIGREHHGYSDQKLRIPVEIVGDAGITDVSELEFELTSDGGLFLADGSSVERLLAGTALEGWSAEVIENRPGHLVVHLTAPTGRTLSGKGVLLAFEGRLYLAGVRGTELEFEVRTPSGCFGFETEPGYAELDSICGLNFRLIELSTNKYAAPVAYPNPARERVTFEFGLGLDGPTKLEVFDQLGHRVGIVLEDALQSGKYSVEWDVRGVSSGVYWYRLTSGAWSQTGQVRVE